MSPVQKCVYYKDVATSVASCTHGCDKVGKITSMIRMITIEFRDATDPKALARELLEALKTS
ncbi:MAG: hypothetical protein H0X04_00100 [Chthoniobacterales bacterium]|nr:hypothetical protein [Chthoniobacterales bacterium]